MTLSEAKQAHESNVYVKHRDYKRKYIINAIISQFDRETGSYRHSLELYEILDKHKHNWSVDRVGGSIKAAIEQVNLHE